MYINAGASVVLGSITAEITSLQNKGSLAVQGTLDLQGTAEDSTSAALTLTGTLTGSGTVRVLDRMTWDSFSFMDGSGTTIVEPSATLTATGTGYKVLGIDGAGRVLEVAAGATLDWDQGDLHLGDSALIDNAGTFVAEGAAC